MASTWPSPGLAGLMPSSLGTPCTARALSMACCLCMVPLVSDNTTSLNQRTTPTTKMPQKYAKIGANMAWKKMNTERQIAVLRHVFTVLIMARQHYCASMIGLYTRQNLSETQTPCSGHTINCRLCFLAGCSDQVQKHACIGSHLFSDIRVSMLLMQWLSKPCAGGCEIICKKKGSGASF